MDGFSSLSLSVIYLLLFDSEAFTFTEYNFRAWYLPLVLLIMYRVGARKLNLRKIDSGFFLPISVLFLLSIYYLVIETPTFKLHIVKYWVFSIGLISILVIFFKKHIQNPTAVLKYLFSLQVFIGLFGLIQYAYMLGGNYDLIRTTRDRRPESFFSETTWYAEFLVLGFLMVFILVKITERRGYLLWLPIFLIGLFISATRNAFLGLSIFLIAEITYQIIKAKIKVRYSKNTFIVFAFVTSIGIILFVKYFNTISEQTQKVIARFDFKEDNSSVGRLEAFRVSFDMMKQTPFLGNGFYWTEEVKAGIANTAVGAKSFNMFFMIYHIFGPFGFAFFLILISYYFYVLTAAIFRSSNIFSRYALYVFTIFFVMAMFAPIHQFPIGMFFVAFSSFLYNCGLNGKNLLHNTQP